MPPGVRAGRLGTGRGSFAVLEGVPRGKPRGTVLMVPGFTGSKEDFLALLPPAAAAGYAAVAVDGRGQYESGGPRSEAAYAQGELAADVLAQAAALRERDGSGGPLHLVGHSLGGHLARAAVLAGGPERWASLTLMSSGPAAIAADQQVRTRMAVEFLPTTDMETAWQAMRAMDAAAEAGTADAATAVENAARDADPDWLVEFLHERWITTVPEQLIATARQLMTEPDRVGELAAVRLPKLVLSGEEDYAWPVPWLDEMAVRLGARRVVVKGAGHSPNAERPEETAAALVAFWTEADAKK